MATLITSVENHRGREEGVLVYPVYSRRSAGLSIGINLFPAEKFCPFDCPYCEVFPFAVNCEFSPAQMEQELRSAIFSAAEQNVPVRDLCFSGNGEPSLSPYLGEALKLAADIRDELVPEAALVLITNGAGLLHPHIFSMLKEAVLKHFMLDIWLKLDAGTQEWYKKINRSNIPFEQLIVKIKDFTAAVPVTIQTMLCSIDGSSPSREEAQAWEKLVLSLAEAGKLRKVQIYGKVRPAPEDPLASPLPVEFLEKRAVSLRKAFAANGLTTPVEVY